MTITIFLSGWLCGALTAVAIMLFRHRDDHKPAAVRLLTGERFPLALNDYEGEP